MAPVKSIYSGLSVPRDDDKDVFIGIWHGMQIKFEKTFRTHTFTKDEFDALCHDEMLELHDLERRGVKYAVIGFLELQPFHDKSGMALAHFKVDHTISYNPDYKFVSRDVRMVVQSLNENAASDVTSDSDSAMFMTPEQLELDARMKAMLSVPEMPDVVRVSDAEDLPVFVPMLSLLTADEVSVLRSRVGVSE